MKKKLTDSSEENSFVLKLQDLQDKFADTIKRNPLELTDTLNKYLLYLNSFKKKIPKYAKIANKTRHNIMLEYINHANEKQMADLITSKVNFLSLLNIMKSSKIKDSQKKIFNESKEIKTLAYKYTKDKKYLNNLLEDNIEKENLGDILKKQKHDTKKLNQEIEDAKIFNEVDIIDFAEIDEKISSDMNTPTSSLDSTTNKGWLSYTADTIYNTTANIVQPIKHALQKTVKNKKKSSKKSL